MANISSAYDIKFKTNNKRTADKLEAYLKAVEKVDPYYNLTDGLTREDDTTIDGSSATGRWAYTSNLEGSFETPDHWFGDDWSDDLKTAYMGLIVALATGGEVSLSWSDEESGCEMYYHGTGTLKLVKGRIQLSTELEDMPSEERSCSIVEADESGHEEDNTKKLPFYCYTHDDFTETEEECQHYGADKAVTL